MPVGLVLLRLAGGFVGWPGAVLADISAGPCWGFCWGPKNPGGLYWRMFRRGLWAALAIGACWRWVFWRRLHLLRQGRHCTAPALSAIEFEKMGRVWN